MCTSFSIKLMWQPIYWYHCAASHQLSNYQFQPLSHCSIEGIVSGRWSGQPYTRMCQHLSAAPITQRCQVLIWLTGNPYPSIKTIWHTPTLTTHLWLILTTHYGLSLGYGSLAQIGSSQLQRRAIQITTKARTCNSSCAPVPDGKYSFHPVSWPICKITFYKVVQIIVLLGDSLAIVIKHQCYKPRSQRFDSWLIHQVFLLSMIVSK